MDEKRYKLVFDETILKQLKKVGKDQRIRGILSKLFDKMEFLGPRAGTLLDSQLFLYEMKVKHPPIRLYYKHNKYTNELYLFEYEMKTSQQKQQSTIERIRDKIIKILNRF